MKYTIIFIAVIFMMPFGLKAQNDPAAAKDYTMTIAWQQHSGEYRALCFQAYNFARLSLNERLKDSLGARPNCVIVDIDETVLDNSPFQGHELKKGLSFEPKDWAEWTSKAAADTVPGALTFLNYAKTRNVETFYVTNREQGEYQATLKNLQQFGFPFADEAHLLVKTGSSDKEPRRQSISEHHNVLLLCGDNLSDFSNVFYRENRNTAAAVEEAKNEFGSRFIVLPNPMYGDWEKLLYKGEQLNETEKSRQRTEGLKAY
jgi:5'-nucleotidase (lipoprotein e(P4) family)